MIKDKFRFWLGIILLILCLLSGFLVTGWVTEGYGITFSFFGIYYSLLQLISPSIREGKK